MKNSKGVYKSCIDEFLKSFALFFCKTLQTFVFFWTCKIIGSMRNIQIAAKNNWLIFFELFAICEKCRIPLLVAKGNAAKVILCIWSVHSNDVKIFEFSRNYTTFCPWIAIIISN